MPRTEDGVGPGPTPNASGAALLRTRPHALDARWNALSEHAAALSLLRETVPIKIEGLGPTIGTVHHECTEIRLKYRYALDGEMRQWKLKLEALIREEATLFDVSLLFDFPVW